jgi:signal transduction histidine kinase
MSQVIINLVVNAVEAMQGCGRLEIRTYTDPGRGMTCLEIADSGCGIAAGDLSRIFDPFFTAKASGKGTGLGLSTAYGIIKEHRGKISVTSTGPAGTTFLIEFPPRGAVTDGDEHTLESLM